MSLTIKTLILLGAVAASVGCSDAPASPTVDGPAITCGYPIDPPAAQGGLKCLPGVPIEAFCFGSGLTGYRTCNAAGDGYDETICPTAGQQGLSPGLTVMYLTRPLFVDALQPLADRRRREGHVVEVVALEDVLPYFCGEDLPERIRAFLRQASLESPSFKHLIMVGDDQNDATGAPVYQLGQPWEMPLRYYDMLLPTELAKYGPTVAPTYLYYANLHSEWPAHGIDWIWDFDWKFDIYPTAIPAQTFQQVADFTAKMADWRVPTKPKVIDFDTFACLDSKHATGHESFDQVLGDYAYTFIPHRCADGDRSGDVAAIANGELPDLVRVHWHGGQGGTSQTKDPTTGETIGYNLNGSTGGFDKPPIVEAESCSTAMLDDPAPSLAERLILQRDGVAGYLGYNRTMWGWGYRLYDSVFIDGHETFGEAVYEGITQFAKRFADPLQMNNMLVMTALGDSSLRLADPVVRLSVSDIAYVDGGKADVGLTINARQSIYGHFTSLVPYDFGGDLTIGLGQTSRSLRVTPDDRRLHGSETVISFTGCDAQDAPCFLARAQFTAAKVDLACHNVVKEPNGGWGFDVRFSTNYDHPVMLVIGGRDGKWFPDGCVSSPCVNNYRDLASWSLPSITANVTRLAFNDRLTTDLLPPEGERGIGYFSGRSIIVDLRDGSDGNGGLISQCWVGFQQDVFDE